jgi:hypothetical protein
LRRPAYIGTFGNDLFIVLRDRLPPDDVQPDFGAVTSLLNGIPLTDYVIETDIPRLHLLKAGCFDESYAAKIAAYEWPALYDRSPHLLRCFADRLARDYSFVVIDSRTGLADTAGICTMLMPEVLVTVFTPSRQSLFGVIDIVRESVMYRATSDDLRPLLVYPLPSRIESLEPALRQSWRYGDPSAGVPGFQPIFEEAFKEIYDLPACDLSSYFDDVQIQQVPSYAYGEEIALLVEETQDRFSLTQSYLRFSARLKKGDAPWASPASNEQGDEDQTLVSRPVPLESGWRWFLSYNPKDQAMAESLIAAIRRRDPSSRLLLVGPASMRVGVLWSAQFHEPS